ncbi:MULTISPECIES: single-stranded DNA-binding protein [Acinetobacter]|uniref:single-stranded DNA-binding protein n=1 Tax=Acinetobacter TaxID=469 RepID=UPI000BDF4E97|nr:MULTISPECIES: single-stranded DNA-binding protein [Acinetobacter]
MRGINKAIVVGVVGAAPIAKQFPNGGTYTQFSIATSEKYQDKRTGEWIENTEWHRIVAYAKLGEIASKYLKKGSKVYIEGSLHTRKWTDQNHQERYTTEIRANMLQSLDSVPQSSAV